MDFVARSRSAVAAALLTALTACSGGGSDRSLPPTASVPGVSAQAPAAPSLGIIIPTATNGELALTADSLPGDHDANVDFIDSIGVNTKLNTRSGVYANYPVVKAALLDLGIRHIRDGFSTTNLNNYENHLADLATSGVHSDLGLTITPDTSNNAVVNVGGSQAAAYLQAGHYAQSIEAIEGINEPDVNQGAPNGASPVGWAAVTMAQQKALYAGIMALKAPARRIAVYGPSVAASRLAQIGDLSAYMDAGNIHDYSGGYDLPGTAIAQAVSGEASLSGTKPIVSTENGYATGTTGQGMPDGIMLDYAQRLFFKQFANNVKRTLWYELLDEGGTPNDYWNNAGLLTNGYAPKSAYTGLKNIIALLKDQTPYIVRTKLNYSFGGQLPSENIEHLLLQKNDGSFWLIVWRDVSEWTPANNGSPGSYPAPAPATIPNALNLLGTYAASITLYTENDVGEMTASPIAVAGGSSAQISIGARPRIYRIVPGVAPAGARAPAIANSAAHWSLDEGAGNVAADSVSAAGNLTVPRNANVAWLTGTYGAGLSFNGTEASTTASIVNTTQSYSATAWVTLNGLSGYQAALAVNGQNQSAFAIDFTPQSNLSFTTYSADSSSAGTTRIGSSAVPVLGRWYAVAATYNGASHLMSLYVNGALQSTATAKGAFNGTGGVEIGSMLAAGVGHYQWWNGAIDEVNLYGRELSPVEVRTMAAL